MFGAQVPQLRSAGFARERFGYSRGHRIVIFSISESPSTGQLTLQPAGCTTLASTHPESKPHLFLFFQIHSSLAGVLNHHHHHRTRARITPSPTNLPRCLFTKRSRAFSALRSWGLGVPNLGNQLLPFSPTPKNILLFVSVFQAMI